MMTPQEKAEFEAMRRKIARIEAYIGMDRQKAADFELQDAMDHMARTQDPTLIKRHLQEQIAAEGASCQYCGKWLEKKEWLPGHEISCQI